MPQTHINICMPQKRTHEDAVILFQSKGFELLETYKNCNSNHQCRCLVCNNITSKRVNTLHKKCHFCIVKQERTLPNDKAIKEFEDKGFKLLESYNNGSTLHNVECLKCNFKCKKSLHYTAYHGCQRCQYISQSERYFENIKQQSYKITSFKEYSKLARALTNINVNKYSLFKNYTISKTDYQVDHIRSVRDCYDDGLSIFEAAHPANLRVIKSVDNLKKHCKSEQTKEELINWIAAFDACQLS